MRKLSGLELGANARKSQTLLRRVTELPGKTKIPAAA
jgi:hypothetical protein